MGTSVRQLYIILWKDIYITRIRQHYFWALMELVFVAATLHGIWNNALETRFGDPVPAQMFPLVHPLQLWARKATKLVYTPNVPLLTKVRHISCFKSL